MSKLTEFLSQYISGLGSKQLLHSDVRATRRDFNDTPLVLPILNHEAEGVSSLQGDLVSEGPKLFKPVPDGNRHIYVVILATKPKVLLLLFGL
jgi:hypothetical protein